MAWPRAALALAAILVASARGDDDYWCYQPLSDGVPVSIAVQRFTPYLFTFTVEPGDVDKHFLMVVETKVTNFAYYVQDPPKGRGIFVTFDGVHPTSGTHSAVSDAATDDLVVLDLPPPLPVGTWRLRWDAYHSESGEGWQECANSGMCLSVGLQSTCNMHGICVCPGCGCHLPGAANDQPHFMDAVVRASLAAVSPLSGDSVVSAGHWTHRPGTRRVFAVTATDPSTPYRFAVDLGLGHDAENATYSVLVHGRSGSSPPLTASALSLSSGAACGHAATSTCRRLRGRGWRAVTMNACGADTSGTWVVTVYMHAPAGTSWQDATLGFSVDPSPDAFPVLSSIADWFSGQYDVPRVHLLAGEMVQRELHVGKSKMVRRLSATFHPASSSAWQTVHIAFLPRSGAGGACSLNASFISAGAAANASEYATSIGAAADVSTTFDYPDLFPTLPEGHYTLVVAAGLAITEAAVAPGLLLEEIGVDLALEVYDAPASCPLECLGNCDMKFDSGAFYGECHHEALASAGAYEGDTVPAWLMYEVTAGDAGKNLLLTVESNPPPDRIEEKVMYVRFGGAPGLAAAAIAFDYMSGWTRGAKALIDIPPPLPLGRWSIQVTSMATVDPSTLLPCTNHGFCVIHVGPLAYCNAQARCECPAAGCQEGQGPVRTPFVVRAAPTAVVDVSGAGDDTLTWTQQPGTVRLIRIPNQPADSSVQLLFERLSTAGTHANDQWTVEVGARTAPQLNLTDVAPDRVCPVDEHRGIDGCVRLVGLGRRSVQLNPCRSQDASASVWAKVFFNGTTSATLRLGTRLAAGLPTVPNADRDGDVEVVSGSIWPGSYITRRIHLSSPRRLRSWALVSAGPPSSHPDGYPLTLALVSGSCASPDAIPTNASLHATPHDTPWLRQLMLAAPINMTVSEAGGRVIGAGDLTFALRAGMPSGSNPAAEETTLQLVFEWYEQPSSCPIECSASCETYFDALAAQYRTRCPHAALNDGQVAHGTATPFRFGFIVTPEDAGKNFFMQLTVDPASAGKQKNRLYARFDGVPATAANYDFATPWSTELGIVMDVPPPLQPGSWSILFVTAWNDGGRDVLPCANDGLCIAEVGQYSTCSSEGVCVCPDIGCHNEAEREEYPFAALAALSPVVALSSGVPVAAAQVGVSVHVYRFEVAAPTELVHVTLDFADAPGARYTVAVNKDTPPVLETADVTLSRPCSARLASDGSNETAIMWCRRVPGGGQVGFSLNPFVNAATTNAGVWWVKVHLAAVSDPDNGLAHQYTLRRDSVGGGGAPSLAIANDRIRFVQRLASGQASVGRLVLAQPMLVRSLKIDADPTRQAEGVFNITIALMDRKRDEVCCGKKLFVNTTMVAQAWAETEALRAQKREEERAAKEAGVTLPDDFVYAANISDPVFEHPPCWCSQHFLPAHEVVQYAPAVEFISPHSSTAVRYGSGFPVLPAGDYLLFLVGEDPARDEGALLPIGAADVEYEMELYHAPSICPSECMSTCEMRYDDRTGVRGAIAECTDRCEMRQYANGTTPRPCTNDGGAYPPDHLDNSNAASRPESGVAITLAALALACAALA